MKKNFILLFILLFLLTSCQQPKSVPYGIWQSESPDIVMDLEPNYEHPGVPKLYYGTYNLENTEISIVIEFGNDNIHIHNISDYDAESNAMRSNAEYFIGTFKVKKNKLYYSLSEYYQKIYGYKQIVFTKIQDYSSVMPTE